VIIHLDTSALVDALTGPRRSLEDLIELVGQGERLVLSTIVLYEWWRGPRTDDELTVQQELFPVETAVPFAAEQAEAAARLYRAVRRARGREVDLAIAACAMTSGAALWTLNPGDFRDVPGLRLVRA
jgi:predicted nucleic acid-binding protein